MDREQVDRKCKGCASLYETGGGVDHGDMMCFNRESGLYMKRPNDHLEAVESCTSRSTYGGRTAVITIVSGNIGRSIAEQAIKMGYDLALLSPDCEGVSRVADELGKSYQGFVVGFGCDLNNVAELAGAFQEIKTHFGSIDVLVNNAGINLSPCFAANYMDSSGLVVNIQPNGDGEASPGYRCPEDGFLGLLKEGEEKLAEKGIRVASVKPDALGTVLTVKRSYATSGITDYGP